MESIALKKLTLLVALLPLLISCGGGNSDDDVAPSSTETQVVENNPSLVGPAFTTDERRVSEGRSEGRQPGDAVGPTEVPAEKLGKVEGREKALAAGDGKPPLELGETATVAPPLATVPADAHLKGAWSGVYSWPLIPIHVSMLPDGRLLSYGTDGDGRQTAKTIYDVFDPVQGLADGHMVIPKTSLSDIFCSTSVFLSFSDQLLTIGGDNYDPATGYANNTGNNSTNLFTPSTNTLAAANNLKFPRWYASATTLLDGTIFIQGGLGGIAYPEVRQQNGTFRSLTTTDTSRLDYWYPHNWVLSDGRIFGYDSYGNYYYINPAGTGTINIAGQFDVRLFGEVGSAVMFAPGRVLQLAAYSNAASVIDFRGSAPILTPTTSMKTSRQTVNATMLPNGKVLATGGSAAYNQLSSAVYTADTWDPATGGWTEGAAGALARLYHSVGMLMPDGTVLVGGGGAWGPVNNLNVEFYYPSYLFNSDGLATRPIVSAAPTVTDIGATFKLTVSDPTSPITRVTMIKTGTVTHSLNLEQNFNELTFTRSGDELTVQAPTRASDAPPGYYMVFALSAAGVPSQARIVKVNVAGAAPNAPTGLSVVAGSTGNTLNWTQSTSPNITSNVIERASASTGPFTTVATVTARTSFLDPITAAGTYYYRVSAVNSSGVTSPPSNVASVTVSAPPPATVPGAPSGLAGTATPTSVSLSWTQGSGTVTQNVISRGTASAGPFTNIATIPAATSYTDSSVTAGTYYYRVQAVNSVGASPPSNVAQVVVPSSGGTTLNAPTNLSGYTCGAGCWTADTGIRFNWTPSTSSGVTQHVVQRATAAAGPWTTVATVGATTGVYVDKNVTSGTTYYYRVQAAGATATSPFATLGYGVTSNITLTAQPPAEPPAGFAIQSQGETRFLVMNWWRGDPAREGNFRQPGICTGPASTGGNCTLGARKTFRPMAFNIASSPASVAGLIMMDVPQFENGVKTFDHYRLPVEFIKSGCTFKVQHVRTHSRLEFPLNPPGLEILDHQFTLTQALCDSYPTGAMTQAWLNSLNSTLDAYLGPKVAYNPIAYPYNDPRTGKDPSQP